MNFWVGLVAGLLIGWLVEWAIDWFYWRKRGEKPAVATAEPVDRELLEDIYGIGPVIAERFRKAGITTFEQLADLHEDEINRIAEVKEWQDFDARSWKSQARDFAKRREALKK